jgi:hypothetical protein
MGVRHPAWMVIAEVLALAEDGYVEVVADDDGYTVDQGPADPSGLWQDRAEVLAGLFHGGAPVRLDRPALPPLAPPQGPISADRIATAMSKTAGQYGFISRLRWLVAAGAVLGLGGALTAMVAGMWLVAVPLATGTGVFLTSWLQSPIRPSGAALAERARLHELRERLRDGSGAADPALLPWAFLLLTEDERNTWWRRVRPVSDQPHWLTWHPAKAGVWPGLMTDSGLSGLARAVAHRMGP